MLTKDEDPPERTLPRDEFTSKRRDLEGHPEAVKAQTRIDVFDLYGNLTTWVIDLYRLEADVTALIQRGAPDGYTRLVMPPEVTSALIRHQAGLITKSRRKVAKRIVADKRARGEQLGNPEALAAARAAGRRRKAKKK